MGGWAPWYVDWVAEEGTFILSCRAFDKGGRSQDLPSDEMFNWGSFGSTQPQQVYVKVTKSIDSVGARIDLTSEQKAAKDSLMAQSDLSEAEVRALYQAPGSQ